MGQFLTILSITVRGRVMKKIKLLTSAFLCLLIIYFSSTTVYGQNSEIGFSVKPLLDNQQMKEGLNYWWVKAPENQTLFLYLQIINGEQENTFELTANQAITNNNFTVDYSQEKENAQKYLTEVPLLDFYEQVFFGEEESKGKLQLSLKANETVTVPIKIVLPENFQGQAIGGINVRRLPLENERKNGILNIYNYATALVIESKELQINPQINILPKVTDEKQTIQVSNPQNTLLQKVSIQAKITGKKGETYAQLTTQEGSLLPKSKFNLTLKNEKKLEKNQTYFITLKAQSQDQKIYQQTSTVFIDQNGKINMEKAKANRGFFLILIPVFLLSSIGFLLHKRKSISSSYK